MSVSISRCSGEPLRVLIKGNQVLRVHEAANFGMVPPIKNERQVFRCHGSDMGAIVLSQFCFPNSCKTSVVP